MVGSSHPFENPIFPNAGAGCLKVCAKQRTNVLPPGGGVRSTVCQRRGGDRRSRQLCEDHFLNWRPLHSAAGLAISAVKFSALRKSPATNTHHRPSALSPIVPSAAARSLGS